MNLPSLIDFILPKQVKEVLKSLSLGSTEIYLVGGFIRDMFLGVSSQDLDFIVIDRSISEFCEELKTKFGGNWFFLDEETQTARFILSDEDCKDYTFDFTLVLKENLDVDFARRDFTINALAINLNNQDVLIDNFSGFKDLKNKIIRAVKLENLLDDPLRFIRAFRFAALLKGEICPETINFIKDNLNFFNEKISSERISSELWKILESDNSYKYVKQIADIGLLEKILPELTPMRKVTPNNFHHLWLFDHSIELVKTFEENLYKIPSWTKEELKNKAIAKFACLIHDIGKPGTWEIKKVNGEEKHTFYGHDKLGEQITKQIGERLKFSNLVIQTLSKLVRYHLRPYQLQQGDAPITQRALYRFFRDIGEDTPLLLILALADLYATLGPRIIKEDLIKSEKLILCLFDEYKKFQDSEKENLKKPKLLNGNEIINLTGLKPGPRLGALIKELDEAIGVGEVKTKEDAIKWVNSKVML
ncbi:MAG: HD domain-containing protein [Candidatus Melainabacteria bacterium]|nr:HD domain-containing protein [Candidatus Melainabacteria bacterium]